MLSTAALFNVMNSISSSFSHDAQCCCFSCQSRYICFPLVAVFKQIMETICQENGPDPAAASELDNNFILWINVPMAL